MIKIKMTLIPLFLATPVVSLANSCNEGNSYDINQCLINTIQAQQKSLEEDVNISAQELNAFIPLRHQLCQQVSNRYQGGTFEGINYGNCVISLNNWYMDQMKP